MRAQILRWASIGFLVGVFVSSFLSVHALLQQLLPVIFLIGCCMLAASFFVRRKSYIMCISLLCIGIWYVPWRDTQTSTRLFSMPSKIEYQGVIHFVDTYVNKQRLTVNVSLSESDATERIYVYTKLYPEYRIGERISFYCSLQKGEPFEGFAWDKYLASSGIQWLCYYPSITIVGHDSSWRARVFAIKRFYSDTFNAELHEPQATVVRSLLLAERQALPLRLRDDFARAGVSHMFAISGMHIALIIFMAQRLLLLFGLTRRLQVIAIATLMTMYLAIIGFPLSALRATIMGLILLAAQVSGRPYHSMHILIVTAAVFVAVNPLIMRYDPGFQLSFLALAGIILTFEYWQKLVSFIPDVWKIRSMIALTMSAQTLTWPVIIYQWDILSVIAPVVNVIAVPLLPFIIVLAITMPFVTALPLLGTMVMVSLDLLVRLLVLIPRFASQFPWSFYAIETVTYYHVIFFYTLTFSCIWFIKNIYEQKGVYSDN